MNIIINMILILLPLLPCKFIIHKNLELSIRTGRFIENSLLSFLSNLR